MLPNLLARLKSMRDSLDSYFDTRRLERTKHELLEAADEKVRHSSSASPLFVVSVPLRTELEKRAAWELQTAGFATLNGAECMIFVNPVLPAGLLLESESIPRTRVRLDPAETPKIIGSRVPLPSQHSAHLPTRDGPFQNLLRVKQSRSPRREIGRH